MLDSIQVNLNTLEYMLVFWQSIFENMKMNDFFLAEIAELPEMASLYDDDFNAGSVRKVLSAIVNREKLNSVSQKEKQFWNNNMWVTEDSEILDAMVHPIKTLDTGSLKEKVNNAAVLPFSTLEIVFVPGFKDISFEIGNKLYVNFFKVMVDIFGGTGEVTIDGKPPLDYLYERILNMDGVFPK